MTETVTVRPFNHNHASVDWPERRGVVIEQQNALGYDVFPSIYVSDSGEAELSDMGATRADAGDMADWLEAAAAAIRERIAR